MMPRFLLPILLLATLFIASCGNDDDMPTPSNDEIDGSIESITTFVTDRSLATLRELGFNFVEGIDQLDLAARYTLDPLELEASNIPNDATPGTQFQRTVFGITDLVPAARSLTFRPSGNAPVATDTYYTVTGDRFNIFAKTTDNVGGGDFINLVAFSGRLTAAGVEEGQYAVIMLDNMGNTDGLLIDDGQGRLFIDGDGVIDRLE